MKFKIYINERANIKGAQASGPDVWEWMLLPVDDPPKTDSKGNYILYHGTILSTAKEVIKTKLLRLSRGWGTGITTRPNEAASYANMKYLDVKGFETEEKAAVLEMVIDKDWFHKQRIHREVGGRGKNSFLVQGDIVPKAFKKVKIWKTFP
jgi:hypothetical protein